MDIIQVLYNGILLCDLNDDKFTDAIVEYWLIPPGANGNGFKPHKAIVASGRDGYTFSNKDFIQDHFSIDSVKNSGDEVYIYSCGGMEYPCKKSIIIVKRYAETI